MMRPQTTFLPDTDRLLVIFRTAAAVSARHEQSSAAGHPLPGISNDFMHPKGSVRTCNNEWGQ